MATKKFSHFKWYHWVILPIVWGGPAGAIITLVVALGIYFLLK